MFSTQGADPSTLIVQSGSGSIITGDLLRQRLRAEAGVWVRVAGQGALSVHRAVQRAGSGEQLEVSAAAGAWLENLAEPRVLFAGAEFLQATTLDVTGGGVVLCTEAVIVHPGAGAPISYESRVVIRRDGMVVARERSQFGASSTIEGGFTAYALVIAAGLNPEVLQDPRWAAWHAAASGRDCYGVASMLPFGAGVAVRVLARDGLLLRTAIATAVDLLRLGKA